MKKVTFILAGLFVIMMSGCSEGSSTSAAIGQAIDDTNPIINTNVVEDVRGLTQFPAVPAIPES